MAEAKADILQGTLDLLVLKTLDTLGPLHDFVGDGVHQKVSSTRRINRLRREAGLLWQGRFFDRAVRTVKEYHEKVEYIHLNAVKRGLVQTPQEWTWSSIPDYTGTARQPTGRGSALPIDRILVPADPQARI